MIPATLHQLKVFEATARQGSFTRAADELEITQPTVSAQVKQLANALGLPLFEQIGKRLYLTDAGQELLATCQEIFKKLDNFEMKVADFYMRRGAFVAAVNRSKYVLENYQGATSVPLALKTMIKACRILGLDELADDAHRILKKNYPEEAAHFSA